MKKIILVFYLSLFPFAFVYSKSGVDSVCKSNIENIFNVHKIKYKYQVVRFICSKEKDVSYWTRYLLGLSKSPDCEEQKGSISGMGIERMSDEEFDRYIEHLEDSVFGKGKFVKDNGERMSDEEKNRYLEQINCTPEKIFEEHTYLIKNIKAEKEKYLKCIDAELAKGESSQYAKDNITPYYFLSPPMQSVLSLPGNITKLDFLKVFKEFVLNDDEKSLPEGFRVYVYLKCNCKIL
jgi:hypothetical protein